MAINMKGTSYLGLAVAVAAIVLVFVPSGLGSLMSADQAQGQSAKVTICHIPPGNPDNAHTITVSENAVPAHLAHGDTLGECYESTN
jgi:hypothetical protein